MTKLTNQMYHMINVCPEVDLRVMIGSTGDEVLKTGVEVEKNIVRTKVVIDKEIDREIEAVIDRGIEAVINREIEVVIDRGIEVVIDREIGAVINRVIDTIKKNHLEIEVKKNKEIKIMIATEIKIGMTITILLKAGMKMDKEKKDMIKSMLFSII
jgi:hypothetical protein